MKINVNKNIISFPEIPALAEQSVKTVLFLRHSFRESMQNGSHDPGLTPEGWEYARQCGRLLSGWKNLCFGSSARLRTVETIRGIMEGGDFPAQEIAIHPEIYDAAMFDDEATLDRAIDSGEVAEMLKSYLATGKAKGMPDLAVFHETLMHFLTTAEFPEKNVILATHDVLVAAVLIPLNVYPFHLSDWCGNMQGALLTRSGTGEWTVSYAVPDLAKREKYELFV